jgi:hypothetical protein
MYDVRLYTWRCMMEDDLQRIILEMIQNSQIPVKSLADVVGKPYSTFMREIDVDDRGAKLGVELLIPLMKACNSITPLRHMAAIMGYRVASMRDIRPEKTTFHEELLDTYQSLVAYHRAMMDGEPVSVVAEYREMLIRKLVEDFVAFMKLRKSSDCNAIV